MADVDPYAATRAPIAPPREGFEIPNKGGDLSKQWEWHAQFRDQTKNMYRTTYTDMIQCREVCVKSNMPSGYGGHQLKVNHNVLFNNTEQARVISEQQTDPGRNSFPCFAHQIAGCATFDKNKAHEETPTFGTLPDVRVQPPWAVTQPINPIPSHKTG